MDPVNVTLSPLGRELKDVLVRGVEEAPRPVYSGAVAIIQRGGQIEQIATSGRLAQFADTDRTPVAPELARPAETDTIFDLASITKLFVTVTLLSLVEEGTLDLDEPVATWLPTFAEGERSGVTLRRLLTHTSGLPDLLSLWTQWPDRPARVEALLTTPLVSPPGTAFEYSCVGFLVAGLLAETVTGRGLAELVRERVCTPLGFVDTGYLPRPDQVVRCAATEWQPSIGRGLVQGQVHDENSWSMGGTGGNAGVFGTAPELARFGDMLRRHGTLDGVQVLTEKTVVEMTRDQLPPGIDPGFRHGLGVRIADPAFMGPLASSGDACGAEPEGTSRAFGHTGFTGTSLVVDRTRDLVVVLLTNRVHPSRDWSDVAPVRRAVATMAAS